MDRTHKLELVKDDFLGYDPDALRCNQCGGVFCGHRIGRVFKGEPLIMCGRKDETKEVLASISRR